MDLIAKNLENNDCVLVAAHNALRLAGKEGKYQAMRNKSLAESWYDPSVGFYTEYIDRLFEEFGVPCKEIRKGTTTSKIGDKVKKGVPFILLCKPRDGATGHAVLAVKGSKGVKIINATPEFRGWRTICRLLKNEDIWLSAYEISL